MCTKVSYRIYLLGGGGELVGQWLCVYCLGACHLRKSVFIDPLRSLMTHSGTKRFDDHSHPPQYELHTSNSIGLGLHVFYYN